MVLIWSFYGSNTCALKNHSSNMGAQKVPQIVANISYYICGSKKNPKTEIQVEIMANKKN